MRRPARLPCRRRVRRGQRACRRAGRQGLCGRTACSMIAQANRVEAVHDYRYADVPVRLYACPHGHSRRRPDRPAAARAEIRRDFRARELSRRSLELHGGGEGGCPGDPAAARRRRELDALALSACRAVGCVPRRRLECARLHLVRCVQDRVAGLQGLCGRARGFPGCDEARSRQPRGKLVRQPRRAMLRDPLPAARDPPRDDRHRHRPEGHERGGRRARSSRRARRRLPRADTASARGSMRCSRRMPRRKPRRWSPTCCAPPIRAASCMA